MRPIVQISLDLTNIDEALETAALAMRAGVDWLEVGTPLILAEGLHGVRKLREAFPNVIMQLNLAGITSNGREMYAKGIIERKFNSELEANQALAIYQSIINSLK